MAMPYVGNVFCDILIKNRWGSRRKKLEGIESKDSSLYSFPVLQWEMPTNGVFAIGWGRASTHTHRRILCFPLWSNGKFATSQEWIVRVLKNRALSKWCLANCELLWILTQRRYQQQHQQQPQKMRIIHSNGANSSNMCMANSFLLTHETTLVYLSVVLWHILCMPFSIARLAHSHCGYAQYCML